MGKLGRWILTAGLATLLVSGGVAEAKRYLHAPDGRLVEFKGGTPQPDMSAYRSPLESKVLDRRFYTNPGMYLANEEFLSGMGFFLDAVKAGFPVAHNRQFAWVTAIESYWYSRYILAWVGARSHLGVSMVHAPYWTLKAQEVYRKNRLNRDRGERVPSNKDVLLAYFLPLYYQRTGMPRVFDDAALTYLLYASGDPHLQGRLIIEDDFDDPQSEKKGKWGVPRYWIDWANTRWSHDSMDTTIDMGGLAQTLMKRILWVEFFFHSDHVGESPSDKNVKVNLLGNDAEEGFRGVMLTLGSFNTILQAKAALITDGTGNQLGGINPFSYDPRKGLRYLPHLISSNLVMLGDLPERVWSLDIKDNSSQLWDQASWLWAMSEYYHIVHRFKRAFTDNPPVDGGIIEKKTHLVARGMASLLVKNLEAMHLNGGVLVSEWHPGKGAGATVSIQDSAMAVVALKNYYDRLESGGDPDPELRKKALRLLEGQADFLLKVQGKDGAFFEKYDVSTGKGLGERIRSTPQWWGIRALVAAWHATEKELYLEAARKTFNLLNRDYWHEPTGLYRTRLGDNTVILTPWDVAATLGGMRGMMKATPVSQVKPLMEQYVRWWVQAVNTSGFQMSENFQTGELSYAKNGKDEDGDGILFISASHGKYGVAPVNAWKVAVNLGGSENQAFQRLNGDKHDPGSAVRYAYTLKPNAEQLAASLLSKDKGDLKERELMEDFGGILIPLPPSKPVKRGSDLSGSEVFRRNCAVCHGNRGEGITGKSLKQISTARATEVKKVIMSGRFENGMPTWGKGVDELAGVLTEEEIDRVVNYIRNKLFKQSETLSLR